MCRGSVFGLLRRRAEVRPPVWAFDMHGRGFQRIGAHGSEGASRRLTAVGLAGFSGLRPGRAQKTARTAVLQNREDQILGRRFRGPFLPVSGQGGITSKLSSMRSLVLIFMVRIL